MRSPSQADGILAVDDSDEDEAGGETDGDGQLRPGTEQSFRVRTGIVDEKAAALCALGMYAQHLRDHFQPFLAKTLTLCTDMAGASDPTAGHGVTNERL